MLGIELNGIGQEIYADANFTQGDFKEPIFTVPETSSKALARRMRIENQIVFDGEALLNEENAKLRLRYLDQMIANVSGEHSDFKAYVYLIEKLALNVYLKDISEIVACLKELNESDVAESTLEDEDDDELPIEGDLAHSLLAWAEGNDISEVVELAQFPDPTTLLLLKAKGIELPRPADFSDEDSIIGDEELDKHLYSRNYSEAIKLVNEQLNQASEIDREFLLQTRGFCKAMLEDYEGALQDYNEAIDSESSFDGDGLRLVRGLIYYLNNDQDKAKADLIHSYKEGITISEYRITFLGLAMESFAGLAIAKILDLWN